MTYRSRWVDTNPDHVDWLENRVEALAARVLTLETELKEQRRIHAETIQAHLHALSCVLVRDLPVQKELKRAVTPPPFPQALQTKFARNSGFGLSRVDATTPSG